MQDEFANGIDEIDAAETSSSAAEINVRPLYRPSIYSRLKPVYVIVILKSKPMPEDGVTYGQRLFSHYTLKEYSTNEFAPSTINIIFASLGFFDKKPGECTTDLDRWCYMFKNMGQMPEVPDWVKDRMMLRLFKAAKVANFNKEQKQLYTRIMLEDFRTKGMIKAARREGREEAVLQTAQKLLQAGVPADIVAKCTNLDLEKLRKLSVIQ